MMYCDMEDSFILIVYGDWNYQNEFKGGNRYPVLM